MVLIGPVWVRVEKMLLYIEGKTQIGGINFDYLLLTQ